MRKEVRVRGAVKRDVKVINLVWSARRTRAACRAASGLAEPRDQEATARVRGRAKPGACGEAGNSDGKTVTVTARYRNSHTCNCCERHY